MAAKVSPSSQSLPGVLLQSLGQTRVQILTLPQPLRASLSWQGKQDSCNVSPHGCYEDSLRWCLFGSWSREHRPSPALRESQSEGRGLLATITGHPDPISGIRQVKLRPEG